MPKRKLYFDPVSPLISEDRFHKFDWEEFYRDSKEATPDDMPKPRGKIMTTHCFVRCVSGVPKFRTPMSTSYHPSEDVTKELNVEGVQFYQEMIGILRLAVEIGRVDILLEVSLLSSHLALPRIGHLQAVYHIF